MSEQAVWAIACLAAGFVIGFLACFLISLRQIKSSFEDGFRFGRARGRLDDWFR